MKLRLSLLFVIQVFLQNYTMECFNDFWSENVVNISFFSSFFFFLTYLSFVKYMCTTD